jgi:hypothetical protein
MHYRNGKNIAMICAEACFALIFTKNILELDVKERCFRKKGGWLNFR